MFLVDITASPGEKIIGSIRSKIIIAIFRT